MGWIREGFRNWWQGKQDAEDKRWASIVRTEARLHFIVDDDTFGKGDFPHKSLLSCLGEARARRHSSSPRRTQ